MEKKSLQMKLREKPFSIADYLNDPEKQMNLTKWIMPDQDLLEGPIQFDRNQIRFEFLGNEDIEYGIMKAMINYFNSDDIDILEYTINCQLSQKEGDENFYTNMEITIIQAMN